MLEELSTATKAYLVKWQALINNLQDQAFFNKLKPTAIAWKTVDLADFQRCLAELQPHCDQVHMAWMNERWLATLHLKRTELPMQIQVIKLMQRRPGSTDSIGLDHLDFYFQPGSDSAKAVVEAEKGLKWSEERNGDHCQWLSIWFEGTEAKLRTDTVLEVAAAELKELETQILT